MSDPACDVARSHRHAVQNSILLLPDLRESVRVAEETNEIDTCEIALANARAQLDDIAAPPFPVHLRLHPIVVDLKVALLKAHAGNADASDLSESVGALSAFLEGAEAALAGVVCS